MDVSDSYEFFRREMARVYSSASRLITYKNAASILAGDHLVWESAPRTEEYSSWADYYEPYEYEAGEGYAILRDAHTGYVYGTLYGASSSNESLRHDLHRGAMYEQFNLFQDAVSYLENTGDVMYFFTYPETDHFQHEYSNVDAYNRNFDYFRAQPVYYIVQDRLPPNQSHDFDFNIMNYSYPGDSNISLYIAVSEYTLYDRSIGNNAVRSEYLHDLMIIAAAALIALVSLVVLLFGAGRRYAAGELAGDNTENDVRFLMIDKPYLDIALVVLAAYGYLVLYIAISITESIWHFRNITALNLLIAAVTVLLVTPALLWLLSFIKRVKAGQFWKHTLVYALPKRVIRFCASVGKTLWAGLPLMIKVGIISAAAFLMMLTVGVLGSTLHYGDRWFFIVVVFVFTAVVAYFLLRYANRIHRLEKGARDAVGGDYDSEINAGGGELGSIAESINNISAGINTAVEQRMKSERLKTELITNVSHDIRTPLTSIITYTDLLKHEGLVSEKAPEYLDILIQKSQRLKTLTDELFEAAKAATGNIDVNITELDIVSLVNQVLGELDGSIKASGIDLRVNTPEKLYVKADGRLMWRVLENLLSNVFKYSLPGSRVYLDVLPSEDSLVRVDLKNISATELNVDPAELTERFKRGDDSRADGGSGLGLSIVQSFVNAQRGRFEIKIDGDLFKATVYLPAVS